MCVVCAGNACHRRPFIGTPVKTILLYDAIMIKVSRHIRSKTPATVSLGDDHLYARIPLTAYTLTFASLCTIVGLMWDISWHGSIGRDGIFSPPHILVYAGAVIAGFFSGIQVLWDSFVATAEVKKSKVRIWGIFYSSLGGLFCIWGALSMIVSAVFDDWWHSAYGLDVLILSLPHALLGTGVLFLQFGACVYISKLLNTQCYEVTNPSTCHTQKNILQVLFVLAAGSFVAELSMWATDFLDKRYQHHVSFYMAVHILLLFLPAFGSVLRLRYGCTIIAATYFLIIALTNWIMQLFPATPLLGPILTPITHLQPLQFPLLLFVPAFAMDAIMRRKAMNNWKKATSLSVAFIVLLFIVQYPFGDFLLHSVHARNWFFGSYGWMYSIPPDWEYRYDYLPGDESTSLEMTVGLIASVILGIFICRISLLMGQWLQKIQR